MSKIAFFNNKGGVGKTTLAYHVAHSLVDQGKRVLLVDLDPQSNLTAMCLAEDRLEQLWPDSNEHPETVLGSLRPIMRGTGDVLDPHLEELREGLYLLPGDLGLSSFEDRLSDAWPRAMNRDEAAFRALSAFHRAIEQAGDRAAPDLVLIDVGPNLGAINRAALVASDFVLTPLAPDLFSMQGLRNLGPRLREWRGDWKDRIERNPDPKLLLPDGAMCPLGYVVMQAAMRLSRPVKAYGRWLARIPREYHLAVLGDQTVPASVEVDPFCLGIIRNHQSLMPLAQDARKPVFHLRPGDGAIGATMSAVLDARESYRELCRKILQEVSRAKSERTPV